MRKISLLFLLLALSMAVSAQVVVGTNLNYSSSSYTFTKEGVTAFNNQLPQGWSAEFSPRVGFSIHDNVVIGFDLGFSHSNYEYTDGFYNSSNLEWEQTAVDGNALTNISAGLFLRKHIHSWGSLSLHAELCGALALGLGTRTRTEYSTDPWGEPEDVVTSHDQRVIQFTLRVVPVFNYSFGNHFSMDAYMDFASLALVHAATDLYKEKSTTAPNPLLDSHTVTTDLTLGLRTLSTRLLTLGFTYQF